MRPAACRFHVQCGLPRDPFAKREQRGIVGLAFGNDDFDEQRGMSAMPML